MQPRTILAVFAHPDDELSAGGTLARYTASGASVTLVRVTPGEAGEISGPALAKPETLAEVRTQELLTAAKALGLEDVRFLGFRDSGMVGTPENADPRSFHQADPVEATRRLVVLIRSVKPDVVITHDVTGGYGHPDHLAAYRHVTAAFDAASDPLQFPDEGPPWQPSRLFYTAMLRSFFQKMRETLQAAGVDTSDFEGPEMQRLGYEDTDVTTTIDASDYTDASRPASAHTGRSLPRMAHLAASMPRHSAPCLPMSTTFWHGRSTQGRWRRMICLVKRENRELATDTEDQRVNDTGKLLDMKTSASICNNGDALYRTLLRVTREAIQCYTDPTVIALSRTRTIGKSNDVA
jgi:LmbE family N-acetylglucosaminyl deacetylase